MLNIKRTLLSCALLAAGILCGSGDALAQSGPDPNVPVVLTTLQSNGDPSNRVDVMILGDGYTADQQSLFAADANRVLNGLFSEHPLNEYQSYFNVHRVDVASLESGADHPNIPSTADTAFDATYYSGGVDRCITVNSTLLSNVTNQYASNMRDIVVVIVNDPASGGCANGMVAAASNDGSLEDVVVHEIGHSFGLLADEYGADGKVTCSPNNDPPQPNVTKETNPSLIKWKHWIDVGTPIPTTGPTVAVPGLYEGAKYCDFGLYRATYNSKMRTNAEAFEQVNSEQLVKRIYNFVEPIEFSTPSGSSVTITQGQSQLFGCTPYSPATHTLTTTWYVDGQQRTTNNSFVLATSSLSLGTHTVEARVADPTPWVREDPQQLLHGSRTWTVNVVACTSAPGAPGGNRWGRASAREKKGNSAFLRLAGFDVLAVRKGSGGRSRHTSAPTGWRTPRRTE